MVITRSYESRDFLSLASIFLVGCASGCATKNLIPGEKRPISFAQLEIRDAGITRRLALPGFLDFMTSKKASTWTVLPRPISSAKHAPNCSECRK